MISIGLKYVGKDDIDCNFLINSSQSVNRKVLKIMNKIHAILTLEIEKYQQTFLKY